MSRPKPQPEQFDVVEFLRESDDDLKSALNSLLRSPSIGPSEADGPKTTGPGPKLGPRLSTEADDKANISPCPILIAHKLAVDLVPPAEPRPGNPNETLMPELALIEAASHPYDPKKRHFPIREMKLAQDAHTRAEQQVYEYMWQYAKPIDDVSRIITIGFGAMARMVRLSESNARINVRSLIAKLAIQEFAEYNCERSVGRTYRIFNYSEILRRRREAGLLWYMRRTLAVVFVNPKTGLPIDLGLKKATLNHSRPGPRLGGPGGPNLAPEAGAKLSPQPGINLGPHNREKKREHDLRETSSSSDLLLFEALSQYGVADDDVIKRLQNETKRVCPDFTDQELIHFIHSKGSLIRRPDSPISSPIGFLLTSVPKCFVGEAFQLFRKNQRETREREATELAQQELELKNWRIQQQAILDDPNAPEEDKHWARKVLHPEVNS